MGGWTFFCINLLYKMYCFFFFKKWAIPGLFFFIFRLFNTQLIVYNNYSILINFCQWLDSNCGPLVSEATALPTEPQPHPMYCFLVKEFSIVPLCNRGATHLQIYQQKEKVLRRKYWRRRGCVSDHIIDHFVRDYRAASNRWIITPNKRSRFSGKIKNS